MPHRLALLLLAALALLSAGCGGSKNTAASDASEVAAIVPADVPLLLAFETDPESEQWRQADELLDRLPGKERLLDELRRGLAQEGISVEGDVLPALGDETYLVFLELDDEGDVVLITKPREPAKLAELLREAHDPPETREVDGWTLIAEADDVLARFGEEGDRLDGSDWFEDATSLADEAALVTLYANGEALQEVSAPSSCEAPEQPAQLDFAVGTLRTQDDGVRLLVEAAGEDAAELVGDETLLERVPARALAYLGAPAFDVAGLGLGAQLRCALDEADVADGERLLGVSYDDILDLFAGGFAFYAAPGLLIPEVTLLLEPKDEARAIATLDALADRAFSLIDAERETRRIGDVDARVLQLGPVSILYGAGDGRVVVTTAPAGFEALDDEGESLQDSERFRDARDAAGFGDEAQVYAYLDLQGLVQLVGTVAGLSDEGVPPEVQANLEPLRSFVAWGDVSDPDAPELGFFLEIE